MEEKSKKLLFLSLSGIGNFLMHSPTIEQAKRHLKGYTITVWVAPRGTYELAKNCSYIDNVIESPITASISHHIQMAYMLWKQRYSTAIVLHPGQQLKSAALLYAARIPVRIGMRYPLSKNTRSSFLLTKSVDIDNGVHDIDHNLRLLTQLGISIDENGVQYKLSIPAKNTHEASQIKKHLGIQSSSYCVGIHAGSAQGYEWKRWPEERFAQLSKYIVSRNNAYILLFGGKNEHKLKISLRKAIGSQSHIIDTSLLTTAALLKQCNVVISNDSGIMHLAAATGSRTYGLFGPTDEKKTGPRGSSSFVIRAPYTDPSYSPMQSLVYPQEPHRTMKAIQVETVLQKLSPYFAEGHGRKAVDEGE